MGQECLKIKSSQVELYYHLTTLLVVACSTYILYLHSKTVTLNFFTLSGYFNIFVTLTYLLLYQDLFAVVRCCNFETQLKAWLVIVTFAACPMIE